MVEVGVCQRGRRIRSFRRERCPYLKTKRMCDNKTNFLVNVVVYVFSILSSGSLCSCRVVIKFIHRKFDQIRRGRSTNGILEDARCFRNGNSKSFHGLASRM